MFPETSAVLVVFVLVWLWGKFGVTGRWQLVSCLITGVAVGILQRFGTIQGVGGWAQTILYGIILGALVIGLYEAIESIVSKSMDDTLEVTSEDDELAKTAGR